MEAFFLFIKDVWASWFAAVGVVLRVIPFIETSIEQWLRRKYAWADAWFASHGDRLKKNLRLIGGLCLVIAFYRAWTFEYRNTRIVIGEKAQAVGDLNTCKTDLKGDQAETNLYRRQVQSQQGNS